MKLKLQWKVLSSVVVILGMSVLAKGRGPASPEVKFSNLSEDPGLIQAPRQITFLGPRSGEGYFSRDGKKMIFQSERTDGNPFYQIFLMDLESGKVNMVSRGQGKTTCAWIHPNLKKALYSSTHLDPRLQQKAKEEIASRQSAQKSKYSWSYDETYDIFESNLKGGNLKRLTQEKGYDAEASYSPDGKSIVFASNRAGYHEKLSAEEQKIFSQDPSYMMDIYVMNSDGRNVRRLTSARGYDGGPFFSADGKKITWRRFSPNGQSAEILTMNSDGSGEKPLTKLKAMSWAPFFHPSGEYVIFTSNILGYSNFELFIVDSKGEKDPIRVSYLDGFDGLPVFSPDGNQLSWTRRNEKGESQIYLAKWDHGKAQELLGLPSTAPRISLRASDSINATDAKAWVRYLASPRLEGRQTGSDQEKEYTARIAAAFHDLGLVPVVGNSFLVPFSFTSGVTLGAGNRLELKSAEGSKNFQVSQDFVPVSFSKTGESKEAIIAFAGYGISAPASETEPAYEAYQDLDVKGKWVLVFRDIPEKIAASKRSHLNLYSRIQHKALVAKNKGALGLLLVNGPNSFSRKLIQLRYDGASSEAAIPVLSISDALASEILRPTGKSLKEWQDANDHGDVATAMIDSMQMKAAVDLKFQKSQGFNVLAQLPVKGAKSTVMIGAHGDHLGKGESGNSLAKPEEQGHAHLGADDNASGVAAVMEIAKDLAFKSRAGRLKLKQNIAFAIWSGEEIGVIGSSRFLDENPKHNIQAYLNMDMIGRLRNHLMVQGIASAPEWRSKLEALAAQTDLSLSPQDDPYVPTDGVAFYTRQVPSITFFTGAHAEYHSPRDRTELINFEGLTKIAQLVEKISVELASSTRKLTYQKVESSQKQLKSRSFRIYLGTIPDYSQEGVKGVKISGTSLGSPAEKAGLKGGDVIIEISNMKVENLYDYVYSLQAMKPNQETGMKVQRQGKVMELKIVPAMKE